MVATKRTDNFTSIEKKILLKIIKNFTVVENKSYAKDVLKEKSRAWEKITNIFNSRFPKMSDRDVKTLRGVWRRSKNKERQNQASVQQKNEVNSTDGGSVNDNISVAVDDSVTSKDCKEEDTVSISATDNEVQNDLVMNNHEILEAEPDIYEHSSCYVPPSEEMLAMSREIHKKRLEILEVQKKSLEEEMALKKRKHETELEFSRKRAKLELLMLQEEAKKMGITIPEALLCDEEIGETETVKQETNQPQLQRKALRDRSNPFEEYPDDQFKSRFRFNKETVRFILLQIGDILMKDTRGSPLTPTQQLFVTLHFYATATFNRIIGETVNAHESTVSRTVAQVTIAICNLKNTYLLFPTGEELPRVKNSFALISGDNFPDIVGCIDGTHIRIACPSVTDAIAYKNRSNFYSINCQIICDAEHRIRNIVARWPGAVNDSRIFLNSLINKRFEAGEINGHLLGDNEYPCKKHLLTPLRYCKSIPEERYNRSLGRARNAVERTIKLWKNRFPCLSFGLRTKVPSTLNLIVATAILHNIAIQRKDEELNEEIEQIEIPAVDVDDDDDIIGYMWRTVFIRKHFT